jgi:hypothetical protein
MCLPYRGSHGIYSIEFPPGNSACIDGKLNGNTHGLLQRSKVDSRKRARLLRACEKGSIWRAAVE